MIWTVVSRLSYLKQLKDMVCLLKEKVSIYLLIDVVGDVDSVVDKIEVQSKEVERGDELGLERVVGVGKTSLVDE